MKKISIIIPCYNSQRTLEDAVASVYTQNLGKNFEIIIVDDCSTDNTKNLCVSLSKSYPEIRTVFHDKNRGGGAARNSGIANSTGNLIYCLDSDNLLVEGSLQKMIEYLDQKKCDGVAFEERRFFFKNTKIYNSHFNRIVDKQLTLSNLFDDSDTLLDNFLFTKESFLKTSGYPENHGFDTQGFEIRYLAAGNSVYICPETKFLHRLHAGSPSYFQRVYECGELSRNYYLIYEEIIGFFSPNIRKAVIEYDIFKNTDSKNNLKRYLVDLYEKDKKNFFLSKEDNDELISSIKYLKENNYFDAVNSFSKLLLSGTRTKIMYYNLLRSAAGLSGVSKNDIEDYCNDLVGSLVLKREKKSAVNRITGLIYRFIPALAILVSRVKSRLNKGRRF